MTEPRWLDEREARAWRGYQHMRWQLAGALSRRLAADSGLSDSDYGVLVCLSEDPGENVRVGELACSLQWEKSRLSHHLARMEKRGLLLRQGCPSDARGAFVALTPEGRAAIEAAAPAHVEAVRSHFIDLLSPEQLDCLGDIAELVVGHLSRESSGDVAESGC